MDFLSFDWLFSPSTHDDPILQSRNRTPGGAAQSSSDVQATASAVAKAANSSLSNRLAGFFSSRPAQDGAGNWLGPDQPTSSGGSHLTNNQDQLDLEPGMWTFLTSRYAVMLIVMGVLVNRIHHICRPRGRAARLKGWKRFLIRLPALIALGYTTGALALRVIQLWAGDFVPGESWLPDQIASLVSLRLDEERRKADEKLLWFTYIAACLGIATESLTRALESATDSSPSFNLMGFSLTVQSHQMEPAHVSLHFFLFVFLEIAEIFSLALMSCWRKPRIKRLHITTFFGLAATLHYLLAPTHRRPIIFGFNKMPDVVMLGVVLLTMALHSLTMLVTEGKIETNRLLFTNSNLPSTSDDYSLALFKLGTACLQSTRLTGLSRELVSIEVPEKTYIEVDEIWGSRMKTGLEGLIRGSEGEGLHNEIRITTPTARAGSAWSGGGSYESVLLMSGAKWREVKRFLFAVLGVTGTIWRWIASYIPAIPPSWRRWLIPRWLTKLPVWIRLAWHGQNGERRREERASRVRAERERQEQLRKEALTAVLRRNGVEVAEGEDANFAAWNAMRLGVQRREEGMRNRRAGGNGSGSGRDTPEDEVGISSSLWRHLLSASTESGLRSERGTQSHDDEDEEGEDGDWTLEKDGEDDPGSDSASEYEEGTPSILGSRRNSPSARGFSRSRSGSPLTPPVSAGQAAAAAAISRSSLVHRSSPLHQLHETELEDSEDEEEEEDTPLSLLQLARRAFSASPEPDEVSKGQDDDDFSQVLLVHAAAPDGSPIVTRARYRSLIRSNGTQASNEVISTSGTSSRAAEDHLRETILRRRHEVKASSGSEEDRAAERERLRLCVVCCYEERTILCWPCRCLALCDGCREELASRPGKGSRGGTGSGNGLDPFGNGSGNGNGNGGGSGGGGGGGLHNCPTCRGEVRGFSRVYLP